MKTFTLLVIFLFSCAITNAQQTTGRAVRPREIAFTQYSGPVSRANVDDSNAIRYPTTTDTVYSVQDIYDYNSASLSYDSTERGVQSFSTDGSIDTLSTQPWDTIKKMYVNDFRTIYFMDGTNYDTLILSQEWNPVKSIWYYVFKTIYGYKNGNDTSYTVYVYDTTAKVWNGANQIIYTFDVHNRLTLESDGSWNGSGWTVTPSERYDNNYNANNNDTAIVIEQYNGSVWDTTNLESYTYYKVSGADSMEIYSQRTNKHTWLKDDKYTTVYNANNKATGTLEQLWNISDSSWHNYNLNAFSFNSYNQTISDSFLSWGSNGPWYVTFSNLYYYETISTAVNPLADNGQWAVYPNPSSGFIHTNITLKQPGNLQLVLVNTLRHTVWQKNVGYTGYYNGNIPVSNLAAGVYLLEMQTNGGVQTKQVVVAK